jgi:hypothetical protein
MTDGNELRLWLTVAGDVRASMRLDLAPSDRVAGRF